MPRAAPQRALPLTLAICLHHDERELPPCPAVLFRYPHENVLIVVGDRRASSPRGRQERVGMSQDNQSESALDISLSARRRFLQAGTAAFAAATLQPWLSWAEPSGILVNDV